MTRKNDQHNLSAISVNTPYGLIDGASGSIKDFLTEYVKNRQFISDSEISLEDRLEEFEDVMESEVGDTSLVRARNLERNLNLRQIYLKFEGGNPTGTQKDRIAFAQCMDAMRRGFDTITLATCGNYGVASSLAAYLAGLKCQIFIPESYHTRRIQEITDLGAEVIWVKGDYEHAVEASKKYAEKHEYYDANPGGNNTVLQLKAYGEIAYEIYDELRDAPGMVAVPVSNGTVIAGIYKGFVSLYRRGKISRIPRMIAGSSYRKNPIIQSYLLNKETCEDLVPERIRESKINEPLINWHAYDGDYALDAIRQSDGWAGEATDKEMTYFARLIRENEGINVLTASTAGLIALVEKHRKEILDNDRFVIVLTGRK
ncbi:MAG: pyridoxal-phosphate dependent enzyme [Bacteroidales bacterium]|jgi:threonine synthase|nr:pyridoxal-phosphate dependent enzyme [Bacteroidales bacterium]